LVGPELVDRLLRFLAALAESTVDADECYDEGRLTRRRPTIGARAGFTVLVQIIGKGLYQLALARMAPRRHEPESPPHFRMHDIPAPKTALPSVGQTSPTMAAFWTNGPDRPGSVGAIAVG